MPAPAAPPPVPTRTTGEVAAMLASALATSDLVFAAGDEPRAVAIAHALAAMTGAAVVFYPASDALPGDSVPASPANIGRRVATLHRIRAHLAGETRTRIACITTGEALGQLSAAPDAFDAAPPGVRLGESIELPMLFEQLLDAGYVDDERVDEPGEVALRGQVLDVYPADAEQPLRIEAADGRIASIRSFDPRDQRTVGECDAAELGRVSEPPLDGSGVALPRHLPDATLVIETAADERRRRFLALAADAVRRMPGRGAGSVADDAAWQAAVKGRSALALDDAGDPPPRFVEGKAPLRAFATFARSALAAGNRIVLIGGARDLRFLRSRIAGPLRTEPTPVASWSEVLDAAPGSLLVLEAPVDRGFRIGGVAVVAAADLLGSRAERDDAPSAAADVALFDLGDIRIGDVVVHEDHGIGIVRGLESLPPSDGTEPGDAIAVAYADNGVRLVPVSEADRLWRYGADADAVALDRLDGSSWTKRRVAIDAAIADTARRMTEMAAEQARRTAPVLAPDDAAYERFAAAFPFAETRDQARAIAAVRTDLASGRPMDRLVIGDVGFGKTEVALRAAALAALAGCQVAIAAPTTVLARQHLETFTERFAGTGIAVAGLSRLTSAAERKRIKAGLADGSIGIVVGTGAVAGRGIAYHSLALVVIDEEQRFGTADKTRLRELGAGHVLTLSATPIPRTLQAALVGVQALSVIATPPARRQPIRTAVLPYDKAAVRAALLRERSRGGQSFVVVPRIEDMGPLAKALHDIVPDMMLLEAHGKMPAADIDEAMVRFAGGSGDVLLATNIIEAGLDVPRANTMVIWRADRFGLSQLHQLRGRVGRGSRRGQVLLLTDPDKPIAARTLNRLHTLEAFDRLGAGFAISARDLDIRGAGDLLGEAQAGHMKLIGVDLYQELLQAALRTARGETVERWTPRLNLGIDGRLPETWVPDADTRVTLYTRLAKTTDDRAIDALEAEMEDRFGTLPEAAHTLLEVARLRAAARDARIARIDAGPTAIALTPHPSFDEQAAPADLTPTGKRLLLHEQVDDPLARLRRTQALIDQIRD